MINSGRGGKREGAGRPANSEELKPRTYRTSEYEDQVIKKWLKKRHKAKTLRQSV